jgi:hypothetical protein
MKHAEVDEMRGAYKILVGKPEGKTVENPTSRLTVCWTLRK